MRSIVGGLGLSLFAGCYGGGDGVVDRAALPDLMYCDEVHDWPEPWVREEARAFEAIQALRERGAECGKKGRRPSAPPVVVDGALTCAARMHAIAMSEQGHVGHVTPDGVGVKQRMAAVDYGGDVIEHLAAGPHTGPEVVDEVWGATDAQCWDLLSPGHDEIGIGFVGDTLPTDPYETYWVVLLGKP